MSLNTPIRTFVISMPASEHRRSACMQAARDAGLDPEWFEAFNGQKLIASCYSSEQPQFPFVLKDHTVLHLGWGRKVRIADKLSPGELGCACSHIAVYKKMAEENIELALILEDDAIVLPALKTMLPKILEYKSYWDVCKIWHSGGIRDFFWYKYFPLYHKEGYSINLKGMGCLNPIFNRRRCDFSTCAYLISLNAARRLLKIGLPVRLPADYLLGIMSFNKLRVAVLSPCEKFAQVDIFDSVIGRRAYHKCS